MQKQTEWKPYVFVSKVEPCNTYADCLAGNRRHYPQRPIDNRCSQKQMEIQCYLMEWRKIKRKWMGDRDRKWMDDCWRRNRCRERVGHASHIMISPSACNIKVLESAMCLQRNLMDNIWKSRRLNMSNIRELNMDRRTSTVPSNTFLNANLHLPLVSSIYIYIYIWIWI